MIKACAPLLRDSFCKCISLPKSELLLYVDTNPHIAEASRPSEFAKYTGRCLSCYGYSFGGSCLEGPLTRLVHHVAFFADVVPGPVRMIVNDADVRVATLDVEMASISSLEAFVELEEGVVVNAAVLVRFSDDAHCSILGKGGGSYVIVVEVG